MCWKMRSLLTGWGLYPDLGIIVINVSLWGNQQPFLWWHKSLCWLHPLFVLYELLQRQFSRPYRLDYHVIQLFYLTDKKSKAVEGKNVSKITKLWKSHDSFQASWCSVEHSFSLSIILDGQKKSIFLLSCSHLDFIYIQHL